MNMSDTTTTKAIGYDIPERIVPGKNREVTEIELHVRDIRVEVNGGNEDIFSPQIGSPKEEKETFGNAAEDRLAYGVHPLKASALYSVVNDGKRPECSYNQ